MPFAFPLRITLKIHAIFSAINKNSYLYAKYMDEKIALLQKHNFVIEIKTTKPDYIDPV